MAAHPSKPPDNINGAIWTGSVESRLDRLSKRLAGIPRGVTGGQRRHGPCVGQLSIDDALQPDD